MQHGHIQDTLKDIVCALVVLRICEVAIALKDKSMGQAIPAMVVFTILTNDIDGSKKVEEVATKLRASLGG